MQMSIPTLSVMIQSAHQLTSCSSFPDAMLDNSAGAIPVYLGFPD
jgi:hypothetical protein